MYSETPVAAGQWLEHRLFGNISPVHDPLNVLLEMLPSVLRKVLMLVVRFTLPIINDEVAEDVFDSSRNFDSCRI